MNHWFGGYSPPGFGESAERGFEFGRWDCGVRTVGRTAESVRLDTGSRLGRPGGPLEEVLVPRQSLTLTTTQRLKIQ